MWSPMWLSENGLGLLSFKLTFGEIALWNQTGLFAGPFLAGFLVRFWLQGRQGVRELWRQTFHWKAYPLSYLTALIGVPVAIICAYIFTSGIDVLAGPFIVFVPLYILFFIGGPLQEEPGWRGVALPLMQQRWHPLTAAFFLGIVHCFWHTPLFFVEDWDSDGLGISHLASYFVLVVALSVVLCWLANREQGNILTAIIAHNGVNWGLMTVGEPANLWPAALALVLLALLVAVFRGPRLDAQEPLNHKVQPIEK